MSEPKGLFDELIYWMKTDLEDIFTTKKWKNECTSAICVLEAAGHTDTMACLKFLERVNEDGEMRDEQGLLLFPLAQIRSLLRKSLPDKSELDKAITDYEGKK